MMVFFLMMKTWVLTKLTSNNSIATPPVTRASPKVASSTEAKDKEISPILIFRKTKRKFEMTSMMK